MNERDKLYVAHLAEAIERIRRFTKSGRAAFMADDMIQSAVVRQIEIIGEAARNLSRELKSDEHSVPWRKNYRDARQADPRLCRGEFGHGLGDC